MNDNDHGLHVEPIDRALYLPVRRPAAGSEPCGDSVTTDLPDLRDTPLGRIADAARDGDAAVDQALQRIAPNDGSRVLLVAASFNSAI